MVETRPNDALLTKCEDLATELHGLGVAISLEEDKPVKGFITAVVWSKRGTEILLCAPQPTRSKALRELYNDLKDSET